MSDKPIFISLSIRLASYYFQDKFRVLHLTIQSGTLSECSNLNTMGFNTFVYFIEPFVVFETHYIGMSLLACI
jgi:hypothetical protein